MKSTLAFALLALAISAPSFAGVPSPGPTIEPGPTLDLDTEAAHVLIFEVPADKLSELKEGANTIKAQVSHIRPEKTTYLFKTQSCQSGIILLCRDIATLQVDATYVPAGERSFFMYIAGEVIRAQR